MRRTIWVLAACVLVLNVLAQAQVPQKMSYQGMLTTSLGTPVPDGSYSIKFEIFNLPTGGTLRHTETHGAVGVQRGTFSVILHPAAGVFAESLFVEVTALAGPGIASAITFVPRTELTSSPYALSADTARYAFAAPPSGFAGGDLTGTYPNPTIAIDAVTSATILNNTITNADISPSAGIADAKLFGTGSVVLNFNADMLDDTHASSFALSGHDHDYLPLAGGTMTGAISNTGNPAITMGKGNFGSGNINSGANAFVAGLNNRARGYCSVVSGGGGGVADSNSALGDYSTVSGGQHNAATNYFSTVGGGDGNFATGEVATVSGGIGNVASGDRTTISGGNFNRATDYDATIGGGANNQALDDNATVAGGAYNTAGDRGASVGGGENNIVSGMLSTIGGGSGNTITNWGATIGGGMFNHARGSFSVVSGGGGQDPVDSNSALADYSTVSGGNRNRSTNTYAVVGGGYRNTTSGYSATVAGGYFNMANAQDATVGGGDNNSASGENATVGGGAGNRARGIYSTISGGGGPTLIDSNSALGEYSMIPGGRRNLANGNYSFAAGLRARAIHDGTFVWGDQTVADFTSTAPNQFLIRASGGVGIGTAAPQGALDVTSTTGAFIVPRMTTVQRDALVAVNGMIIYNTTTNQFNFREAGAWVTK